MLASLLTGAAVGAALGLAGAGGGILAIPLLTFGAGLTQTQAAPIALIATALTATVGAILGLREGVVRYRAVLLIGAAGMLVGPAGVLLAMRSPQTVLSHGLALVMELSALLMFRRSVQPQAQAAAASTRPPCYWSSEAGRFVWTPVCAAVLIGIGLTTGAATVVMHGALRWDIALPSTATAMVGLRPLGLPGITYCNSLASTSPPETTGRRSHRRTCRAARPSIRSN